MSKIFIWSKTIHRLFLYITTFLVFFMSISGILSKFIFFNSLPFIEIGLIRKLHNDLSIYFVLSLTVMMITGLYMYIFPLLQNRNK
jgi:hypothetical protein